MFLIKPPFFPGGRRGDRLLNYGHSKKEKSLLQESRSAKGEAGPGTRRTGRQDCARRKDGYGQAAPPAASPRRDRGWVEWPGGSAGNRCSRERPNGGAGHGLFIQPARGRDQPGDQEAAPNLG